MISYSKQNRYLIYYMNTVGGGMLRRIVISTQNRLLSGAIMRYIQERSDLQPVRILEESIEEPLKTCMSVQADVLLMEVTRIPPYTFEQRRDVVRQIRENLPQCRIAFICDENADPEDAKKVKESSRNGNIDTFFYSSVTGEYLADMLDTL